MALEQEAILVSFTSSAWAGKKADKNANAAIAAKHGNAEEATQSFKYLVDPAELELNTKAISAVRTWNAENSLPWENKRGGARLLPGANWKFFKEGIDPLINAALDRFDFFAQIYPELVKAWEPKLNGLYDPKNYPQAGAIRDQFAVTVSYSPLPLSPQSLSLRFLGKADFETLAGEIGAIWQNQETRATADLWKRLVEAVGHMAEKLADPKGIFRDTLVNNLADITDLIPRLNFAGDAALDALAKKVKERLTNIDPEILRTSPMFRGQVAGEAGAILREITGAGGRFIDFTD